MRGRFRSFSILFFAILVVLIALPHILESWFGVRVGDYLSWLDKGIEIGRTRISLQNIAYLIAFLLFITYLTKIIRRALQEEVLPRTRLEIGARASLVNIIIYSLWVLAIYTGLNILGINLSSLAFMAGALGIGVGFGLQNIVNNFVSGIILLFDPSIQVGDMVQVGEDWGTISRINIRTTVVQSFDNASLIIPNSQMLSDKVTNWSYKDPKVRRQVDVGVAYGSDVQLVRKLLLQIAGELPEVLGDPAPRVDFMNFGDSALAFRIRFWISSPDYWLTAPTEFRFRIDEEFRKHGVEIAFPQQDIHIRSASGLDKFLIDKNGFQGPAADQG
jgi:potassium efflux system protein